MKKIIFFCCFLIACNLLSQESEPSKKAVISNDSSSKASRVKKTRHEFGVNITYLVMQAFGGSGSTAYPIQPYQLTYKLIRNNKWALRGGFGASLNNTNSSLISSTTNPSPFVPPDNLLPNYSHTKNFFYRAGWEHRFQVNQKFVVYAGVDLVGQSLKTESFTNQMSNDIPSSYRYYKEKVNNKSAGLGIGPVLGIQWYCTRRISLFTEIPMYYMLNSQRSETYTYNNTLQSSGGYFSTESNRVSIITGSAFTITLPVTIYFAVKF